MYLYHLMLFLDLIFFLSFSAINFQRHHSLYPSFFLFPRKCIFFLKRTLLPLFSYNHLSLDKPLPGFAYILLALDHDWPCYQDLFRISWIQSTYIDVYETYSQSPVEFFACVYSFLVCTLVMIITSIRPASLPP